ncbi:hypothetical protein BDR05DRAFT_957648 [Suillus weaverae]|nr:hypothetical protein BDR05DRAFT_957648 [Suillus weaverae]
MSHSVQNPYSLLVTGEHYTPPVFLHSLHSSLVTFSPVVISLPYYLFGPYYISTISLPHWQHSTRMTKPVYEHGGGPDVLLALLDFNPTVAYTVRPSFLSDRTIR